MKKLYFCDKSCTFAAEMDILALIKSSGVRNFAKLLSANVVAQVIGLVVYPILTRIYAPEDFGLLNLFLSISGVLVILSTAEYYNAIVLPKEDNEARKIIQLCLCLMLLLVVITGVSVLFSKDIASLFNTPDLAKYYWLMPILVLASGGWNIVNYWYIRCGRYDKISAYQLSQSILSSGGKIGFGYAGMLTGGMIYSVVLAPLVALCTSLFGKIKMAGVRNTFCFQDVLEVAKRYKNFPLYSLPRSFVNMLAGQLPVLLLTPYFGSQYVGWWSMALLLGFIPVNMVSRSIYQVLYQYTTERVNKQLAIGPYFRRFTWGVLLVGVPVFAALFCIMPWLTSLFLGDGWEMTSTYLRWMLPWLLSSILTASTGFLADIFMKQKVGFWFELFTAFLRVVGVVLGIVLADFSVAILCYSVGTAVAVTAQYIWLISLVKHYDAQISVTNDGRADDNEK